MKITRSRAAGVAFLSAVVVSVACSSSGSDDNASTGGSGGSGNASAGGTTGHAGTSASSAGRGGNAGSGGNAGKGGTSALGGEAGALASGGAGGDGGPCAACPSGQCLPSGECVECLPANDTCAAGSYCTSDNKCVPGCKDGDSCASGICTASHDCQSCIADTECAGGRLCGNGQCIAPCADDGQAGAGGETGQSCGTGLSCCSLHCVDPDASSAHCGACGTVCDDNSFCGSGQCRPKAVASVCTIGKIAVLLDGQGPDEDAGREIATALTTGCTTPPTVREVSQVATDVTAIANATTGQPVSPGNELIVAAGGFFFEKVEGYAEAHPVSPVYGKQVGQMDQYLLRADDSVISSFDSGENTSDYVFVIQLMRDPASGSLILNAQGFFPNATTMAADYWSSVLFPTLSTLTKSWYVYHWVDGNADHTMQPNEVTLVQSG